MAIPKYRMNGNFCASFILFSRGSTYKKVVRGKKACEKEKWAHHKTSIIGGLGSFAVHAREPEFRCPEPTKELGVVA